MFGVLSISTINADTGSDNLLTCVFVAPTRVISNKLVKSQDTMNLRRVRFSGVAQRWQIESDAAILDRSVDFFVDQIVKNFISTVFVRPPLPVKNLSVTVGIARISTSTEYPLPIKGLAESDGAGVSTAGIIGDDSYDIILNTNSALFKGDFVRFDGHDKCYMITDVTSIVTGTHTSTITIFPKAIAVVAASEAIYLGKRATMRMLYDFSVVPGISYLDGILADPGRLTLVEEL